MFNRAIAQAAKESIKIWCVYWTFSYLLIVDLFVYSSVLSIYPKVIY